MEPEKKEDYEMIIQPTRNFFHIDWKEIFHYRDLLFLLVRRDFVARYKQTVLGPLWFILQPLLTTVVFTVVFGKVAKIPTNELPPMLFYLCGLLAWDYFAQCLSSVSTSLTGNVHLFSKVYFPRLIIPLSIIFSNLMKYALQLAVFLGFYFYFKIATPAAGLIQPNAAALVMLPAVLALTAVASLGVGLWICALTVRYRDFQHLVGFAVQLWMYGTPVIYPLDLVPEKWKFLVLLNPMSQIVEFYRLAFFGTGTVSVSGFLLSGLITAVLFYSGLVLFKRSERTFVDTI